MSRPEGFDAMRFCDPQSTRYGFGAPFTLSDGTLCATDTRLLIVFPADWHDGPRDLEGRKPAIGPVMVGFDNVTEWHRFPAIPDCEACKNTGKVGRKRCGKCNGTGIVECNMGHEHDCDDCDGTGYLNDCICEACSTAKLDFGGLEVAVRTARVMASLPDAEWGLASDNELQPIYCRFRGGRGGFMGMKKENV